MEGIGSSDGDSFYRFFYAPQDKVQNCIVKRFASEVTFLVFNETAYILSTVKSLSIQTKMNSKEFNNIET